jgi:hypothetical protein
LLFQKCPACAIPTSAHGWQTAKTIPVQIMNQETMLKLMGLIIICQTAGQVTNTLVWVWLQVFWNMRPRVFLAMFVLDALKGHLTLDVRPVIMQ